jgi:hypothetical protein
MKKRDFEFYASISKLHALERKIHSFLKQTPITKNCRQQQSHTFGSIFLYHLHSESRKMVTAKIKATNIVHNFLLSPNSHNPSLGRTKPLFIQKKTN